MDPVVERKWFDFVLLESAALGLDQGGDVGLQESVLTFDSPDFNLQAVGVDLAAVRR